VKRGINIGEYSRSYSINVRSLSDFSVTSTVGEDKLKIWKERVDSVPNTFNVTILVPKAVNSVFRTSVEFKNSVTGDKTAVPLKFDPSDTKNKPV
jgi:hypothetical protein